MTGTPVANDIRRLRFEHGEMTQQALLAGELSLAGILVLLVIVSGLSGHASVIASCRAERR